MKSGKHETNPSMIASERDLVFMALFIKVFATRREIKVVVWDLVRLK